MYLLPKPGHIEKKPGSYEFSYQNRIVFSEAIRKHGSVYASILRDGIQKGSGITLSYTCGRASAGDVRMDLSKELKEQQYRLKIREDGIFITAGDGAGVLYGVQTLCQIVGQCGGVLECMEITDAPDRRFRGYFLDESRGRVLTLPYLKKVVDRLSRYKINQFQLYVEHTYLFEGLSEMWRDETPLTAGDILELDAYCSERHIELIPALASFGHLYTLLSTKSFGELCELEDSWKAPFSFWDRMRHHTVNATDPKAIALIKHMLEEYMSLFSSNKCNICADETFDLGRGKSKNAADRDGVHRLYIEYVKELCVFLVERGKQPMFWGDIICGEPDLIQELPEQTICLTWGYAPNQRDDECRAMARAGARQYLCPGVCGWNQWINLMEDSYQNIRRMCGYARTYEAEGILNTDWGDCGHVSHPEYSLPGMIYGAAFSWNPEEIGFDEINRQISVLEYGDASESIAGLMAKLPEHFLFTWWNAVVYYETYALDREPVDGILLPDSVKTASAAEVSEKDGALCELRREIKRKASGLDGGHLGLIEALDITIEGIRIWNRIGILAHRRETGRTVTEEEASILAEDLESWFMSYKNLWRSVSREGDLHHVAEIVFWYADFLRGKREVQR